MLAKLPGGSARPMNTWLTFTFSVSSPDKSSVARRLVASPPWRTTKLAAGLFILSAPPTPLIVVLILPAAIASVPVTKLLLIVSVFPGAMMVLWVPFVWLYWRDWIVPAKAASRLLLASAPSSKNLTSSVADGTTPPNQLPDVDQFRSPAPLQMI